MVAKLRRIISNKFFPLCWTFFTVLLLCLPGSIVPGTGIFGLEHLDKIVHIILFALNVLFWGWHYKTIDRHAKHRRLIFVGTTVLMIALGIILEFIQLYFIPNRAFDNGDILADIIGSVLAGVWLLRS